MWFTAMSPNIKNIVVINHSINHWVTVQHTPFGTSTPTPTYTWQWSNPTVVHVDTPQRLLRHSPRTITNLNLNLASLSPPDPNITEPHWMCRAVFMNPLKLLDPHECQDPEYKLYCSHHHHSHSVNLFVFLVLLLISAYRWCSVVDTTWHSAVPEWRDPQSPSHLQIMFTYGSHSELPSVELFVQIYPLADSHSHTVFIISFCLVLCEYFSSGDTNTTFPQPSYRHQ